MLSSFTEYTQCYFNLLPTLPCIGNDEPSPASHRAAPLRTTDKHLNKPFQKRIARKIINP